jgi:hypothetical protein
MSRGTHFTKATQAEGRRADKAAHARNRLACGYTGLPMKRFVVASLVISAALAGAASPGIGNPLGTDRYINLVPAGATYDPASIQVFGDRTRRITRNLGGGPYSPFGGVVLTAIGSDTRSRADDAMTANTRAQIPMLVTEPGLPDSDYPGRLEPPYITCGALPGVGRAPTSRPRRNGVWKRVRWQVSGCTPGEAMYLGQQRYAYAFPVADGVTTYTVSRFFRRVRPATYATYREGSDGYFNVCLTSDNWGSVVQRNGVRQCTVVETPREDSVSFTVTQRTQVTKVYPAYVGVCRSLDYTGTRCTDYGYGRGWYGYP